MGIVAAALSGRPPAAGSMSAAIQCRNASPVIPFAARTSRASGSSRTTAMAFVPLGSPFQVNGNERGLAGPRAFAPKMAFSRPTDTRPLSKPVSGAPCTAVVETTNDMLSLPSDMVAHPPRRMVRNAAVTTGLAFKKDLTESPSFPRAEKDNPPNPCASIDFARTGPCRRFDGVDPASKDRRRRPRRKIGDRRQDASRGVLRAALCILRGK